MRIGIDGYNLALPKGTGVATYGATLARLLGQAGHRVDGLFGIDVGRDPALREVMFYDRLSRVGEPVSPALRVRLRRRYDRVALNPFARVAAVDVPQTGVDAQAFADRLPRFDRLASARYLFEVAHRRHQHYGRFLTVTMADPPAVMHWTYPVPVRLAGARNIYTLHDLVPLRLPHTTLDAKPGYHRLVADCVRHADHICTVSEASRDDIVTLLGADPARVTNTYQASPLPDDVAMSDPAADAAAIEGVFGLRRHGYFLYFGAIEPKKNLGRLIEAYLSLDTETPLVLVGGRGWRSEEELQLLPTEEDADSDHGRRMARRIIRLDHLPRSLLLRLIRGARAVTFPSICEGFGLPVLEAMQLGTPVLTADFGAVREVAGDAGCLVDPYDVAAIAAALRALDGDADLRARLSRAGPGQAERFSPARYLTRLEAMYATVAAGR